MALRNGIYVAKRKCPLSNQLVRQVMHHTRESLAPVRCQHHRSTHHIRAEPVCAAANIRRLMQHQLAR